MMIMKINNDIALSTADAIVNASNGIGFMGGKSGLECRKKGVAESLHFISQGAIEPLAKTKCKKHGLFGYAPGNVFITPGQPIKFCVNNNPSSNKRILDCGAIRLSDLPRVNSSFLSAECYARRA